MQRVWRGMLFGVGKIGCKAVAFYRSIQQHCKRSNRHVQVAWRTRATWLKPRVESPTLVQDSTNLPGRLLKSARTLPSSRYCLKPFVICTCCAMRSLKPPKVLLSVVLCFSQLMRADLSKTTESFQTVAATFQPFSSTWSTKLLLPLRCAPYHSCTGWLHSNF